jgi:CrcB protein
MIPLAIFVGAGLGGVARYVVGGWVQAGAGASFPWGTLVVNVSGSLLLGFLYSLLGSSPGTAQWRAFVGVGFCGGYTTFSTFSYEAANLVQGGEWNRAVLYMAGSVLLSLMAMLVGFRLAANLLHRG